MSTSSDSTGTVALLTPGGRGAVATIRLVGPLDVISPVVDQFFAAANGRSLADQIVNRIVFGHWSDVAASRDADLNRADLNRADVNRADVNRADVNRADVNRVDVDREDVVLCRTGEESIEIHCHGGDAATRRLFGNLTRENSRLRRVEWQQQLSSETSAFDAECVTALTRATTRRTAALVARQTGGLLRAAIDRLIDLAESPATSTSRSEQQKDLLVGLDQLLRWSEFGIHLTTPWHVVLAGRPNVGKSTLINALLGYSRSIVFDQPGTTRDVVSAETAFDGWPVRLSDTAGLRATDDEIEVEGVSRARQAVSSADLLCLVFDRSSRLSTEDRELFEACRLIEPSSNSTRRCLIIVHKTDLPNQWEPQSSGWLPNDALEVSSATGEGIVELTRAIVASLIPKVPDHSDAIPLTARQVEQLKSARTFATAGDIERCGTAMLDVAAGTQHSSD
jgi:tRNA modification GTPase